MIESTSNPMLAPGPKLQGYVIEEAIGRGAFGAVYRARSRSGAPVALKVIDGHGNMERLFVEPEILSRLEHPNIVRLLDYFVDDGALVLAMEYVEGVTLDAYLRERGRLSAPEVRDLLAQLAQALDHAHRRGVLHRDIKPSNILVDRSGVAPRFILADFGVARIAQGIQLHRRVGGTYHFMAPEQLRGRAATQSDLWALGVVAYAALSGKLPFEGATLVKLSRGVLYGTPPAPTQLGVEVSAELDDIILRLLEKQLENRTATAAQLLSELGRARSRASAPKGSSRGARTTWEATMVTSIRWSWFWGITLALVATLPDGLLGGILGIGACAVTIKAYRERRRGMLGIKALARTAKAKRERRAWWLFAGVLVLVVMAIGASLVDPQILNYFDNIGFLTACLSIVPATWSYAITAPFILRASRLKRELDLARGIRVNAGAPDALLKALWQVLDEHPDDITVQLRYTEALLAAGNARQAVVEAKLVLCVDLYNVGATLILAHAYFELGLHTLCIQVCDAYLAVMGYGFEFANLRQRAALIVGER